MHFSIPTILAVAPLLLGVASAAPAAPENHEHHLVEMITDLDKQGHIEWQQAEGGRYGFIPEEKVAAYSKQKQKQSRDLGEPDIEADVFARNSADLEVDGQGAHVNCKHGGRKVWVDDIMKVSSSACTQLVNRSAAGQALNKGWNVFQQFGMPDKKGKLGKLTIGWQWLHKYSTQGLTAGLCEDLMKAVFPKGKPCGEKGDTHGAKITWDDQIKFEVDAWKAE